MTDEDRELLEMAAKAAELQEFHFTTSGNPEYMADEDFQSWCPWNPLTNDGDALRLAVTLNIRTKRYQGMITAEYPANDGIHEWCVLCEPVLDDYFAATRRAIVRAAAEIGRAMK